MTRETVARHTVATLVDAVSDADLVAAVEGSYALQPGENVDAYLDMRSKLRGMTATPTAMNCCIYRACTTDDPAAPTLHVYGVETGSNQRWAIEYRPWAEWLGMAVVTDLPLSDAEMLSAILYEMSWVSFDESKIAERLEEFMREIPPRP